MALMYQVNLNKHYEIIDFTLTVQESTSDIYTSKVNPRTERVRIFIMAMVP